MVLRTMLLSMGDQSAAECLGENVRNGMMLREAKGIRVMRWSREGAETYGCSTLRHQGCMACACPCAYPCVLCIPKLFHIFPYVSAPPPCSHFWAVYW